MGPKASELRTTLLLVEEDVVLRLGLSDYLRTCGYQVLEAANGAEAKRILEEGPSVAVLLMEAQLAGDGSGFELSKWVRRKKREIAIVLTGGLASKTEAAAKLCESKSRSPYSLNELKARIASMRSHRSGAKFPGPRPPRSPRNQPQSRKLS